MSISPAVNIFLLVEKLSRLEKLVSSWHTWFPHIRGLLLVVFALSTMQTMNLEQQMFMYIVHQFYMIQF